MASSSTSSLDKSFKYDVFLSFRGEDTRTNFIDHLYHALQNKSIHTYKDDEKIKKGKNISDELIGSIEDSKFYIIVFSKNYASSSWCLDELVKIMECHRTNEHIAYPVFYDVEPSEVRKQSGPVAEAFAKHEKEEAAGKWREALKESADLSGWELKKTADGHEAKFIKKIVEEISLELRSTSFNIDGKLVGMETRIKTLVPALGNGCDDVRMIGIKGMGGGGKTTLARAVFDHISFQFEGKSFVENVRENASLSGLKSLQKQVLSDVLNEDICVSSISDGKYLMKRMLPDKKVLVVLDDVDHIDQLEALAGELTWFKLGSRIIITTRDEQVLVAHRVEFIRDVSLLSDEEAICLFKTYTFWREVPSPRYEELSRQVVRYAAGLPLTIKVLGSSLCGKNELEWVDALKRLETIPLTETLKKLEISYISLDDDYKEIFLDIACNLKGWEKDDAIRALESCGFCAIIGLRVLEQKSLVAIYCDSYGDERVGMHDHVEEMGRNIVRRSHPDEPHKHSRLWKIDEIEDVLANDLGTKATKYIQFHTKKFGPHIYLKGLRKMKKLRFLSVSAVQQLDFSSNLEFSIVVPADFPNTLRYLHWSCYPFRSLPTTFQANNLVALRMDDSRIVQLWEGGERKVLNKLRFLDLSRSRLSTFDLGLSPNLEKLTLKDCHNLLELHMTAGCLKLTSVNLEGSSLMTLDLGLAPNLEELILLECKYLQTLHFPESCLTLRCLLLTYSNLRTLHIGMTPNLEKLDLKKSYCLEELHMANECQKLTELIITHSNLRTLDLRMTPNLKKLDLKECSGLVELHTPVGCLKKLAHVDLSGCLRFRSFNFNIEDYTSCSVDESLEVGPLAELHLFVQSLERCPLHPDNNLPKFRFDCDYKEDRPSLTRNLEMLLSIGMCSCTNLKTFSQSICGLQRLRKLELKGSFVEVIKDLDQLESLEELILLSTNINHLPDSICKLKRLKTLKLDDLRLLDTLPEDLGQLEYLEELGLLSADIKHLPDSIYMFKHLKSLELSSCVLLETLPDDLHQLECLEKLTLSSRMIKRLPDSIYMLKHLKSLKLTSCWIPEKLLENLGRLEHLEELDFSHTMIKDLPGSIYRLKHLKSLKLRSCLLLEKLPEDLGQLECLEELDLSFTKIKHLPDSICMLKRLKYLILSNCSLLEKLPEDLGQLKCLEELSLGKCEFLQDIPNSICEMKRLNFFSLRDCIRVEKLPEELGRLECLEELYIDGTRISHLPRSIHLLEGLLIVGPGKLLEACGFKSKIHPLNPDAFCYV
ncbi:disease resistance protein RPV1 [Lactuca sativa]|uniref:TIR domain-containing protein n=1 Tax=Lactuca sativa TaxID=4236 RepID=A0A9R1VN77_LACSA|nr:disease resistance protein RPV1 [Lactuca sativa]KAJ0210532.1 hypothetical protein LSAT_V11C400215940 [Lactuca sativa]